MKKKIICFDLDNVICFTKKNLYKKSKPNKMAIKKINSLYEQGFEIKIFTSRYMGRCKESKNCAKKRGYKFTKKQLDKWNLKYSKLIFGKPSYDLYVDDKAIFFKKNWYKSIHNYTKKLSNLKK
tara:strand:- start:675 stop:1046 length:372 start_codon:yes stop_codon:yes gene_type:complete